MDNKSDYIRYMERKLDRLQFTRFSHIKENFAPFINQFKGNEEKYVAYKIIDLLNYYNQAYLNIYVRYLLNELRRRVYVETIKINKNATDKEVEEAWDKYLSEVLFVPLSDKTITDSAYRVIQSFKDYFNSYRINEDENISNIEGMVELIIKGKKHIFIIDDFVGSGYQIMEKFLPKYFNFNGVGKKMLSEVISENPEVEFEFFVLSSSVHGKEKIEKQGLKFNCIDLYTDEYSIIEYNTIDWVSRSEFDMFVDTLDKIVKDNEIGFEHTMNLPILFDHSSPKPSHPIYWNGNKKKNWVALRLR